MDIVSLAVAGFVLAIAFFGRQLLIERRSLKIIFGLSLALFVAAVFLPIFMRDKPVLFPSLMNPLVSLGLFLLMRKLFVRWKKREPIDTFFDWRSGLAADRWFNILYFSVGVWLLFLLWLGGNLQQHEYELYPPLENIDHSKTKAKSPQTNNLRTLSSHNPGGVLSSSVSEESLQQSRGVAGRRGLVD